MKPNRTLDRVLYAIAGVGPLIFLAVASAEGLLRSDYDPMAEPISALAVGPRGWVQEVNFVLLAVAFLAFAIVLRNAFRGGKASLAAPALFTVMTLGVVVAAAFPMDAPHVSPTDVGRLHDVGGFLVFPVLPIVVLLVARRFRHDPVFHPYFKYTLATGFFCLALVIFFLLFVGPPTAPPRLASEFRGLVQRILLVPFFTWMALVARRAYANRTVAVMGTKRVPSAMYGT